MLDKVQQNSSSSTSSKQPDNQFGLGLVMGFFIGSTSYFLFKTDKGKEMRELMTQKWKQVSTEMPNLQEIMIGDMKLSEIIESLLGKKVPSSSKSSPLIQSTSRSASRKQEKPKKFKGV